MLLFRIVYFSEYHICLVEMSWYIKFFMLYVMEKCGSY